MERRFRDINYMRRTWRRDLEIEISDMGRTRKELQKTAKYRNNEFVQSPCPNGKAEGKF